MPKKTQFPPAKAGQSSFLGQTTPQVPGGVQKGVDASLIKGTKYPLGKRRAPTLKPIPLPGKARGR